MFRKNFQFADNVAVNLVVSNYATLIFGEDWKASSAVEISHPCMGCLTLKNKQSGWTLEVLSPEWAGGFGDGASRGLSCSKNGRFENPAPNVAAVVNFYASGTPAYSSHFFSGGLINPPDGTPSQTKQKEDGSLGDCWYVDGTGNPSASPVSNAVMARRIKDAKLSACGVLCRPAEEIIALKSAYPKNSSLGVYSRPVGLSPRLP